MEAGPSHSTPTSATPRHATPRRSTPLHPTPHPWQFGGFCGLYNLLDGSHIDEHWLLSHPDKGLEARDLSEQINTPLVGVPKAPITMPKGAAECGSGVSTVRPPVASVSTVRPAGGSATPTIVTSLDCARTVLLDWKRAQKSRVG